VDPVAFFQAHENRQRYLTSEGGLKRTSERNGPGGNNRPRRGAAATDIPETNKKRLDQVPRSATGFIDDGHRPLMHHVGAVFFGCSLACTNVATYAVARAAIRQKEMEIRRRRRRQRPFGAAAADRVARAVRDRRGHRARPGLGGV